MRDEILNIDYLKSNHTRMYYFGLGFIQVVLNPIERVHFYSTEIPAFNEEIHNHRYNFTSEIIKGQFIETRYKLIAGDSHILSNEACNKNVEINNSISINVGVQELNKITYKEGEAYNIFYNEFHSVGTLDNTITYLKRSPIIVDYAQVLYERGVDISCPFANNFSDNYLWDIIENTIKL